MMGSLPEREEEGAVADDDEATVSLELRQGYQFLVAFGMPGVPGLLMDELGPLGAGQGPNASRQHGGNSEHTGDKPGRHASLPSAHHAPGLPCRIRAVPLQGRRPRQDGASGPRAGHVPGAQVADSADARFGAACLYYRLAACWERA